MLLIANLPASYQRLTRRLVPQLNAKNTVNPFYHHKRLLGFALVLRPETKSYVTKHVTINGYLCSYLCLGHTFCMVMSAPYRRPTWVEHITVNLCPVGFRRSIIRLHADD